VVPSEENCHCHVWDPAVAHTPPVAVKVAPIAGVPAITGAEVFAGIANPESRPHTELVEPFVSNAM
jgi:hypothetical protein